MLATTQLEKIFFNYILKNRKYLETVEVFYFKNEQLKFVYKTIKEYYLGASDKKEMSRRQMWDLIKMNDKSEMISAETFKNILKINLEEYNEKDFIKNNFDAWILKNRIKYGVSNLVEDVRGLDDISDLTLINDSLSGMKESMNEMFSTKFIEDDDLGCDFDDAESHYQDLVNNKVSTGISSLDTILNGGWDVGTLNVLMAETNNGKSLWMQNLAVNAANLGKNVVYVTLEMSEKKILKRLGSMRLKIPINDYDSASNDTELIGRKIENLKSLNDSGGIFDKKNGKIRVKFWAAGTASVEEFDTFLEKLEEKIDFKTDLLVIDYLTLMSPPKRTNSNNNTSYFVGKYLSEGLRAIGAKYNIPVVSGVQVSKDAWNSSDITLESVPESKAIAETADTFFAIIRTEEMKKINLYRCKLLKSRDGDFSKSIFNIDLNTTYLTLENDRFME